MSQTQESSLKKASTHLGRILLILTIIGATAFWISYFYTPIEIKEGDYSIQAAEYPEINTIELEYLANFASVDIRYDAPESILFNASWMYIYSPRENVTPIDLNFSATQSPTPNVLRIAVEDTSETFPEMGNMWKMSFFFVEIHLNPMYQAILDIRSETASFSILAEDVNFSAFDIALTTGSINVDFGNVTLPSLMSISSTTGSVHMRSSYSLLGDVSIIQTTGSLDGTIREGRMGRLTATGTTGTTDFVLENLSASAISLERTTGSIELEMNLVDFEDLSNVSIDLLTSTGSINLNIVDLACDHPVLVTAEASTGSIDVKWMAHYHLLNNMTIDLTTGTGSIDVDIKTIESNFDKFLVIYSIGTGEPDIEFEEL